MNKNELEDRIRSLWKALETLERDAKDIKAQYQATPKMYRKVTDLEQSLSNLRADLQVLSEVVQKEADLNPIEEAAKEGFYGRPEADQ